MRAGALTGVGRLASLSLPGSWASVALVSGVPQLLAITAGVSELALLPVAPLSVVIPAADDLGIACFAAWKGLVGGSRQIQQNIVAHAVPGVVGGHLVSAPFLTEPHVIRDGRAETMLLGHTRHVIVVLEELERFLGEFLGVYNGEDIE